jgi:hypothetical protein
MPAKTKLRTNPKSKFGFPKEECRVLSQLNTPKKVQDFVDRIEYNLEEHGETCYSPRRVLMEKKANCIEGAIFAAAALRFHGHPPLIVDLTSVRDDDHILAVFKKRGHWGAIAKSKYSGLVFREPIHRTIRELAISYFESYFNFDGEKTLRGYSRPINLSRFDSRDWMKSEKDVFFIADYLNEITHKSLITNSMVRDLRMVTPLMKEAGELWMIKRGLLKKPRSKN